jgi:hypothetical protein
LSLPLLVHDDIEEIPGHLGNKIPTICRVRIYLEGTSNCIVVYSEMEENSEGPSVTNAAEHIAAYVMRNQTDLLGDREIMWIEHYPYGLSWRGSHPSTFDEVVFTKMEADTVAIPKWKHLGKEKALKLGIDI